MVKSQLQVYVRIKPTNSIRSIPYTINKSRNKLQIQVSRTKVLSNSKDNFQFNFTKIFDKETTQQDVFSNIAIPVIKNCLDGYNGTIFAYGQTGSGKTFTMNGGESWHYRGIIPRVISNIFDQFQKRSTKYEYRMLISFTQIYNQNAYDLLEKRHLELPLQNWGKVTCYQDDLGVVQMRNLSSHQIRDEQQAIDLLMMGNFIKKVSSTSLNQSSSRSHCVFTITIEGRDLKQQTEFTSKLHLVDLAGSERISKTNAEGTLLTEAKSINLSLSYLEQVIVALNQKLKNGNRVHIPYRNSLMTTILKDSLGGNCRTVMIATISAQQDNLEQTISTLRFSQRVGQLQNEVVKNQKNNLVNRVKQLQKQNFQLTKKLEISQKAYKDLKNEMCMRDISGLHNNKQDKKNQKISNQDIPIKPSEITNKVESFLNDKSKKLEIRNLKQVELCFQSMKDLYHNRMKQYVTQLSFISEKLHKYDELLSKKKILLSREFSSQY